VRQDAEQRALVLQGPVERQQVGQNGVGERRQEGGGRSVTPDADPWRVAHHASETVRTHY